MLPLPQIAEEAGVRAITLPPCSPKLNPVERLWDVIKDHLCNRAWADLEELMEAINAVLVEYRTTPARVRPLIRDGWLLDTANASYPNDRAA